eukprot:TRINITY_DN3351_c0_g2_i1.p1 TRINITY_DN3351_c0_g2~~TRINITY_DN3351_c0_g2_i1.p1  ORF type:complete len:137 (-),score=0.54 TRINITY_DN3351_c0_g2_i1:564-974(-)
MVHVLGLVPVHIPVIPTSVWIRSNWASPRSGRMNIYLQVNNDATAFLHSTLMLLMGPQYFLLVVSDTPRLARNSSKGGKHTTTTDRGCPVCPQSAQHCLVVHLRGDKKVCRAMKAMTFHDTTPAHRRGRWKNKELL